MMRDIIAALLRSRGYVHDDASDPNDMFWYGPTTGVRPMLSCLAHEMNKDLNESLVGKSGTVGFNTYEVSTAYRDPSSSSGTVEMAGGWDKVAASQAPHGVWVKSDGSTSPVVCATASAAAR